MKLAIVGVIIAALLAIFASPQLARKAPAPQMLGDIRFYVSDRRAAEEFFIERFGARVLPQPGPRAAEFITFLGLRAGEGAISVSTRGLFPGARSRPPDRLKAEVAEPPENPPPVYGVYWIGICTSSINQILTRLEIEGVRVNNRSLNLPHDNLARAVMIEGPEQSRISLVERRLSVRQGSLEKAEWGDFGVDHLVLLVKSAKDNEKFFRDVFAGRVTNRRPRSTTMKVAKTTIILAEPEVLGLRREEVRERDPRNFKDGQDRPSGIDQLGFRYDEVKPAVEAARAKGYKVFVGDSQAESFNQTAMTFTPDGLPCELTQEERWTRPRASPR